jgi:hypothetical protein
VARRRKGLGEILGLPTSDFFRRPRTRTTTLTVDLSPYSYDEIHVSQAIVDQIKQGQTDRALIAVEVCERLFRGYVVFPPGPDDLQSAQLIWALVTDAVEDVANQYGIADRPWQATEAVTWEVRQLGDPGYPWEQPSLDVHNSAVPSTFIEVGFDDAPSDYDSLIRSYLSNALVLSGGNAALATGTSSTSKRLRRETRQLFNGIEFHDKLYGQTNVRHAGGEPHMLNEQGRGLNWRLYHANNLERLSQGLPAKRTTTTGGRPLPAPHSGRYAMLLWLPAIDQNGLRGSNLTVRPLQWSDGSSTQEPPPIVQQLGVDMSGVDLEATHG